VQFICLDQGFQGNGQLKANTVQTFAARRAIINNTHTVLRLIFITSSFTGVLYKIAYDTYVDNFHQIPYQLGTTLGGAISILFYAQNNNP
jgi:hypothetical protein